MKTFISYSSKEYDEALQLKKVLETNGFECWMAPQSIPAGSDYGNEIPAAIKGCDAFIVVLSQLSQESLWVPKELDLAITNRKIVIPFHIDQSDLKDSFNFRLSNVQRIESYGRLSGAYEELCNTLSAVDNSKKDSVVSFNRRPGTKEFLYAKSDPKQAYKNGPITVGDETFFWILASISNDCPDPKKMAQGVRLGLSIEKVSDYETRVRGTIICPNASPKYVSSTIRFTSDRPFSLEYYNGSAFMYSSCYGLHSSKQMALTDEIMTEKGTLLGYTDIDGVIPGGNNNTVTASIKVAVVR